MNAWQLCRAKRFIFYTHTMSDPPFRLFNLLVFLAFLVAMYYSIAIFIWAHGHKRGKEVMRQKPAVIGLGVLCISSKEREGDEQYSV